MYGLWTTDYPVTLYSYYGPLPASALKLLRGMLYYRWAANLLPVPPRHAAIFPETRITAVLCTMYQRLTAVSPCSKRCQLIHSLNQVFTEIAPLSRCMRAAASLFMLINWTREFLSTSNKMRSVRSRFMQTADENMAVLSSYLGQP